VSTNLGNRPFGGADRSTAFQSISSSVLLNQQTLYADPYVKYLASSGDPVASAREFNKLYSGLAGTAASSGSKFGNAFEELQALLRANNYSDGKSAIGIVDGADRTGLAKAIQDSLAMGQTDVIQFLTALSASGGRGGGIQQPDTTKKFVSSVTKALQYKDLGDATRALTDSHIITYGYAPSQSLITDFQKKWNAEVKAQSPTTTTKNVTKFVPVYDKSKPILTKSGKPKLDKNGKPMYQQLKNKEGILQYEPVTKSKTFTTGEGFTAEEQQAFMANYLATNMPSLDPKIIGGAAKNVYDALAEVSRNNYDTVPSFQALSPTIAKIIGAGNSEVAKTLIQKYQDDIRRNAASRFMSIAEEINAGNDAKPIIDKYTSLATQALETTIGIDDPIMKSILNYKDEKGNYRLPNELEISNIFMNDPRSARTSRAINEAVNVSQSLQSKLQLG
jgi:hypothetical protein